ncbi:hypothetical protein QYF36_013607 [Acer negundo]|nr:hypothetical protein QYF36_013607 [Acer negundo]
MQKNNAGLVEEGNAKPIVEEDNAEPVEEYNVELVKEDSEEENVGGDAINYGSDKCLVDNEYKVGEKSEDDSDVSLDDSDNHQWASNPSGTISFEEGQIIGNAKFTREVIKRHAIQEGFTLKKIKNDGYRNIKGSHSMCPRVVENKEATSRWVASVIGNFIHSNPNGNAKLFKNELQERFAVKVDNQTIYKAKKIALKTLKSHHVEAYAKLRNSGNAIR